jgi:class 3 adenylate cyclase
VRYLSRRNETHPIQWHCRIGIATGAVIGSVVGVQKYIYDVFGPAVSQALRLRTHAAPMTILAGSVIAGLVGDRFSCVPMPAMDGGESVFRIEMMTEAEALRGG